MLRYAILAFVVGIAGAIIARPKGRSPILWFILCGIAPPLIIAVALMPPVISRGITKKCPNCSEIIKADAKVCKYCGSWL